jgi:membrane protein DedA with SNARE-associated domain
MSVVGSVLDVAQGVGSWAGGLGLAAVMAVESVVPPIPSEIVLPLAGSQLAGGHLAFLVAVLAATVGSVVGAWALYAVGRFGGRPLLLRLHPLLRIDEARLARAEAYFACRGDWLVMVGRLVPGVRALVSVPAGMARMPLGRFTVLTAAGSFAWNAGLIEAGRLLAQRWAEVATVVAPASTGLLAAALAAVPVAWLWRRARAAGAVTR